MDPALNDLYQKEIKQLKSYSKQSFLLQSKKQSLNKCLGLYEKHYYT